MLEFLLGASTGVAACCVVLYLGYKRFISSIVKRTLKKIEIPDNENVILYPQARIIKYQNNGQINHAIMPFDFKKVIQSLGITYILYFDDHREELNIPIGEYITGCPRDYGITKIEIYNTLDNVGKLVYEKGENDDTPIRDLLKLHLSCL